MTPSSDPKYPIHRMFVVKLERDATPDALCGRLENLVSGKQRDFTSASELCRLMEGDLETGGSNPVEES